MSASPQTAADWRALPLDAGGRSLIEASAGTGKTWTISVLYLRLLLEQALSPTRIVVTTYTDAAAQELRERIRARLDWAESVELASAHATPPPDAAWLHARWNGDAALRASDLNRIRLARAELDLAPIGTLHGLCRRILADFPFESGSPFAPGELVAAQTVQDELIDDLWRRLGQGDEALTPGEQAWWQAGRKALATHLRAALAPGVEVAVIDPAPIEALMQPANAGVLRAWADEAAAFTRSNSRLRTGLIEMAGYLDAADPSAPVPTRLAEALEDSLEKHLKPAALADPALAPRLALARELAYGVPRLALALRSQALARWVVQLRERRAERLAAAGQITFDELIERVYRALPAGGSALAERLFAAWPVALVDEFQDTDALQYAILDRVYRARDGAPRGHLLMIGDPKQAIYRFRGGDIDAYLEARASATGRLALATNHRSTRALVAAVNAFHARAGVALSSDPAHPIRYEPVQASARRDGEPYRIDGEEVTRPLQIHYRDDADVPDDAGGRVDAALRACANQIVALLSGGHALGERPLAPGDIAVLLPGNQHVEALRVLLAERRVPCVTSTRGTVFASPWARELQIVLYAALHPRDDGAVRAALATRLGGRRFEELRALRDAPERWQREAALFERLDHLWRTRGVLAAIEPLIGHARDALLARGDAERSLTDLRHLGELLQARSEEVGGREQLLAWFGEQRRGEADDSGEERQLRIESDAPRVRLMTLHASKGLEFPVVLLPLMWANRRNAQDRLAIVHDAARHARVLSFDADDAQRYAREGQDERFRLLYVALTRASHACHVYALSPLRPKQANASRPDADPERAPLDAMIERLLAHPEPPETIAHVAWTTSNWNWPDARWQPPAIAAPPSPRVLAEPPPARVQGRYSFSSLLQQRRDGAVEERAASDEAFAATEVAPDIGADEPEQAELRALARIAGADFGNALHAIFEHRVVGRPIAEQAALVRRCLVEEGLHLRGLALDELVARVSARVQATLDAPLPLRHGAPRLGALPAHALCAEMAFDFVLDEVSLRRLRAVCSFVPGQATHALRGLMTGKIDLVFEHRGRFHVLDYKTNRLGDGLRVSDYAPERLDAAIDHAHYRFQALLYTIALERYLRQRVPDYTRADHLGEAVYLFVRATGIDPVRASHAGIWTHRFDDALLDAVDAVLAGEAR